MLRYHHLSACFCHREIGVCVCVTIGCVVEMEGRWIGETSFALLCSQAWCLENKEEKRRPANEENAMSNAHSEGPVLKVTIGLKWGAS
jgi:hypothetical protein